MIIDLLAHLPFEWARYEFMRNALVAVILVSPLFALMGTLVVNNRMAFFSDAIGHASLTGIGLGVLLGLADPLLALVGFALLLGLGILTMQRLTRASMDTIISLSMSFSIALGVVLLSRGGNFNRYSHYLIGDLLSITPRDIGWLCLTVVLVGGGILFYYNRILLIGLNDSLARSRGLNAWWTQVLFVASIVMVVTMNLSWVGILIINSLLILPAVAAHNIARNTRQYVLLAMAVSLASGVVGLLISYYAGTASGATIVLVAMGFFLLTLAAKALRRGGQ
ncbi:MAG: metal ABC transporter permease [Verrucomicrobia bacterium]|nr:metal ABC transporter permease [Verrucomicrobiota bacterium]